MSPLDKSIVSSPAWVLSLGLSALFLVSPRPSVWWLSAGLYVVQAAAGVFLIAFPLLVYRRARERASRS